MNPIKKYQNVSYKELVGYSASNPNKNKQLKPIVYHKVPEKSLNKLGLEDYSVSAINPVGILGLIAYISDPNYYYIAPKNARIQIVSDLCTKLQEQTDDLKNTSLGRKRKKIYDLIGASFNGTLDEDKEQYNLFTYLGTMCKIQFIIIKEAIQESIAEEKKEQPIIAENGIKGEILFSSDPSMWSSSNPVWIVDYRAQWIAVPLDTNTIPIYKIIDDWLTTMSQTGWIIQWHEVDSTKTELIEMLSVFPSWDESMKKMSKNVLSAKLGRLRASHKFTMWKEQTTFSNE
jgi:hypothetical protein